MVAYYFLALMFVAIPTWFIWWILKDSRPVYFLAHQVLQKVFRYSPDYEKEKLEGKKLKTLEALLILFEHVVPLTLGLTLGIYTFFVARGDYEYIDGGALWVTFFITYGALVVFHYGIRFIRGSIREFIFSKFFMNWYDDLPDSKLRSAYDFFMDWIIPVTLSLAFGIWWYLVDIGVIIL